MKALPDMALVTARREGRAVWDYSEQRYREKYPPYSFWAESALRARNLAIVAARLDGSFKDCGLRFSLSPSQIREIEKKYWREAAWFTGDLESVASPDAPDCCWPRPEAA